MKFARSLVILVTCGGVACGGALYYRAHWHPTIVGRWSGAATSPTASEGPSDRSEYVMPIEFHRDGTFQDASLFIRGTWTAGEDGVHLTPRTFYGMTRQAANASWSRQGRLSERRRNFLQTMFLDRTLKYSGRYLTELDPAGSASFWYLHD